jgi:hypothetical protein
MRNELPLIHAFGGNKGKLAIAKSQRDFAKRPAPQFFRQPTENPLS